MSQTLFGMASGIEKDDIEFRATISGDLLNATFEENSPASNMEKALERTLEQHVTSQDDSLHSYSYHHAAQVIRMIIKAWRKYKVNLGEEFEPGCPLDGLDLGYTAADVIKDDINNPTSLPYKVRSCMTLEMKLHLNRHEFTQEKLQGIIDGASKAYLNIMAVALAMAGDAGTPNIEPDPEPSTATYTAVTANSPDARGTKRKGLSPSSDVDQKEGSSAQKPAKRSKKSTSEGGEEQKGTDDSPKPSKKSRKPKPKATGGAGGSLQIIDETPALDPNGMAGRGTDGNPGSGRGNHGHGPIVKWVKEEDDWVRDQLRANPDLYFTTLTNMHNERWEGTTFDDGKNGTVQRGKRTQEAIQRRFVKFRQELRGTKKDGSGTQGARVGVKGSGSFSVENLESSITAGTARPQPDPNWLGFTNAGQDEEGEEDEDEETGAQAAESSADGNESDDDALGDLEELERRVDAGESFEDE